MVNELLRRDQVPYKTLPVFHSSRATAHDLKITQQCIKSLAMSLILKYHFSKGKGNTTKNGMEPRACLKHSRKVQHQGATFPSSKLVLKIEKCTVFRNNEEKIDVTLSTQFGVSSSYSTSSLKTKFNMHTITLKNKTKKLRIILL